LRHKLKAEPAVARIEHGARLFHALLDDQVASHADIDRAFLNGTDIDREQKRDGRVYGHISSPRQRREVMCNIWLRQGVEGARIHCPPLRHSHLNRGALVRRRDTRGDQFRRIERSIVSEHLHRGRPNGHAIDRRAALLRVDERLEWARVRRVDTNLHHRNAGRHA
jgi:hypothetical protein